MYQDRIVLSRFTKYYMSLKMLDIENVTKTTDFTHVGKTIQCLYWFVKRTTKSDRRPQWFLSSRPSLLFTLPFAG